MLLTRRRHTTNLTSPARSRRLRRAKSAPMSLIALPHADRRRLTGTPLLRFLPLQRLPARDALSVAAVLRTIPLRRFPSSLDPRVRGPIKRRCRPCGLSLCECDAVKLDDGRRLWFRTSVRATRMRRLNVHTDISTTSNNHSCAKTCRRIRLAVTCTSNPLIKRHRFAHSPNRAGHASPLRSGRCSATDADSSRPGRVVGPSLGRPGGAHGVPGLTLRRFAPAYGWRIISDRAGPTCLFVQPSRPD